MDADKMRIMTKKINLKITIEETAERHPVPVLGIDYKVKIVYKNEYLERYWIEL